MRELGKYLIAKPRNAGIIAFLCTLLPLIYLPGDFISGIIVALVTLARGTKAGLIVLAWVAIPAISLLYLRHVGQYDIVFLRSLVTWGLAVVLISEGSWRSVFELSAGLGVLVVLALHIFVPDLQTWWMDHIRKFMTEMNTQYNFQVSKDQMSGIISHLSSMATGAVSLIFFLACILQVALGRYWQFSIHAHRTLLAEFSQVRFGPFMVLALLAALLGVFLKSPVIIDFFPLMLLPFLGSGLAILHTYAKKNRGLTVLLVLIYVGFILLPILSVVAMAGLGFLDSWVNFRGKAA